MRIVMLERTGHPIDFSIASAEFFSPASRQVDVAVATSLMIDRASASARLKSSDAPTSKSVVNGCLRPDRYW